MEKGAYYEIGDQVKKFGWFEDGGAADNAESEGESREDKE